MLRTSDIRVGAEISCIIDKELVNSAKIQIENDRVFICQNVINGYPCQDRLGYHYSWHITIFDRLRVLSIDDFFAAANVRNVKLKVQPEWDEENNK